MRSNGGRGGVKNPVKPLGCGAGAAGTVYFHSMDFMLIHNYKMVTDKYTRMSATQRQPKDFPGEYLLSEYVHIGEGANVKIKNRNVNSILFPILEMLPNTTLSFEMTGVANFAVKYREHFFIGGESSVDFTSIEQETRIVTIDENTHSYVRLGRTKFSQNLRINATVIHVLGLTEDPINTRPSKIELYASEMIILEENAKLAAHKVFLYSQKELRLNNNTQIVSKQENECTTDPLDGNTDLFQCIRSDFNESRISNEELLKSYNKQYKFLPTQVEFAKKPQDITQRILKKWNIYMVGIQTIDVRSGA